MKPIEDILADKIYELVNYVLAKKIKPDMKLETVGSLTKEDIRKLKEELGVQGVILDIDETVRKDMKMIPKCNEEWLDMLKQELKVIVVSNGIDGKVEDFLKTKGIDYIGFAHKPMKRNFIRACEKIGIAPEKTLVIGDSLWSDIFGGKRNNMKTALVKRVEDDNQR